MKIRYRAALAAAAVGTLVVTTAQTASAHGHGADAGRGYTFAVIGDIPYGAAQIANDTSQGPVFPPGVVELGPQFPTTPDGKPIRRMGRGPGRAPAEQPD